LDGRGSIDDGRAVAPDGTRQKPTPKKASNGAPEGARIGLGQMAAQQHIASFLAIAISIMPAMPVYLCARGARSR
jgi:hypothetical protein